MRGFERRKRQGTPRPYKVTVRLSEAEYEAAQAAAAAARLSLAAYLATAARNDGAGTRSAGWSVPQRRALAAGLYWVRHGLRGAWSNLNRLTRIAEGRGRVPPEVPATATAIAEYLPRLEEVMVQLDPQTETAMRNRAAAEAAGRTVTPDTTDNPTYRDADTRIPDGGEGTA